MNTSELALKSTLIKICGDICFRPLFFLPQCSECVVHSAAGDVKEVEERQREQELKKLNYNTNIQTAISTCFPHLVKHVPQPRPPEHLHGQQVPGDADEREGGDQDAVEPVVEEVRVEGLGGAVQVVVRRGRGKEEDLEKYSERF